MQHRQLGEKLGEGMSGLVLLKSCKHTTKAGMLPAFDVM
jgi:hypothetical protein